MEVDGAPPPKRAHVERPARSGRRDERNAVMAQAKALWEEMRPKATDAAKTAKLATQLADHLRGRVVEFVFRHDGSRIIQWLLTDASEAQRSSIMDELLAGADAAGKAITPSVAAANAAVADRAITGGEPPFFVRLACDRYGRHLALKLLRVATKIHRAAIFESYLRGNTPALIKNAYGADVLDFAFQTNLNASSRAHLVIELLFSREKKFLAVVYSKLAGSVQKNEKLTFATALELVGVEFKDVCVDSAGQVLSSLIDKDALVRLAIVHAALDEYLDVLMSDYPAEKSRELCGLLAPSLVHLAHTKPGLSCAIKCVKVLDAKHRKKVVRSLKGHVRALANEECGHRLLIALFEWVDDTKLVGRAITAELYTASKIVADIALQHDDDDEIDVEEGTKKKSLTASRKPKPKPVKACMSGDTTLVGGVDIDYLGSLFLNKFGRMLFLSLLFPRDTRYFNPDMYGYIWEPKCQRRTMTLVAPSCGRSSHQPSTRRSR
jgi:pumilio homology domain family member 6